MQAHHCICMINMSLWATFLKGLRVAGEAACERNQRSQGKQSHPAPLPFTALHVKMRTCPSKSYTPVKNYTQNAYDMEE